MAEAKHNHDPYLDDESDFDEEYFERTYRPLSNLPTPPPSCRDSLASISPSLLEPDELLESALLGPTVHLVNLIPPTASLTTPLAPTVHEILTRANLPAETIALAVCILDSLNAKFSQNWRTSCPLARVEEPTARRPSQFHIDTVRPEVIILASLVIAVKFLEDYHEPTHHYASSWGNDLWTCAQINATERCIMESLGYRIMPLWDRALIQDALADMDRAGRQASLDQIRLRLDSVAPGRQSMSSRTTTSTCWVKRLAPAETPTPTFKRVAWRSGGDDGGVGVDAPAGGPTSYFAPDPHQLSQASN